VSRDTWAGMNCIDCGAPTTDAHCDVCGWAKEPNKPLPQKASLHAEIAWHLRHDTYCKLCGFHQNLANCPEHEIVERQAA